MDALAAPLHDVTSNGAYMVMAVLAWNLKRWLSLSLKLAGNAASREKRRAKTPFAANGFFDVLPAIHLGSNAGIATGPAVDLPTVAVDTVKGVDFSAARIGQPAASSLTCVQERRVTSDARARPH